MASIPPVSHKREDFKEEFLTCSICAESYDDGERVAKCLPCLHSFCKSCLHRFASNKAVFACPKCRRTVKLVAKGELDSLPNNFIVENLKEYQDIFNLAVVCGNCDEGQQAVAFCHDCGCFVCQGCVDGHQRMRSLRLHRLSTMAELQEKKCNPMMQHQYHCEKHPKQELTLYCQDDKCKVPACATCAHVDHRGHDLVFIEAAVDKIVSKLQVASAKVYDQSKKLASNHTSVKQAQTNVEMSYNQKVSEMQGTVQELHHMIDSCYKQANKRLEHLFQSEKQRLEEKSKAMEMLSSQMSSARDFTDSACSMSHPVQLLKSSGRIMLRLSELQNTQLPMAEKETKGFVATDNHRRAMGQFRESLKNLCDIDFAVLPRVTKSETLVTPPANSAKSQLGQSSKTPLKTSKLRPSPDAEVPLDTEAPPIDPSHCTIVLDKTPWRGKVCTATVTAVDSNKQPIKTGGADVKATFKWSLSIIEGLPCAVEDNSNGTYTITYTPLVYGANELTILINDKPIQGSPFVVHAVQENY